MALRCSLRNTFETEELNKRIKLCISFRDGLHSAQLHNGSVSTVESQQLGLNSLDYPVR